jgi:hypothetical protein
MQIITPCECSGRAVPPEFDAAPPYAKPALSPDAAPQRPTAQGSMPSGTHCCPPPGAS